MANHRMFSKDVMASDDFLDLPPLAQILYIHTSLNADDFGFVNKVKSIQRQVGASKNDLQKLVNAGFLYVFESGVAVDMFWRVNNSIRKDRLHPTAYQKELECLQVADDGRYILKPSDNQATTTCQPNDNQVTAECHSKISKDKLSKDNISNNDCSKSNIQQPVDKSVDNIVDNSDEQQEPDKSSGKSLDGLDFYKLSERDAFEAFRNTYPRRQGRLTDVQTAWVTATVGSHILPGDLVMAAKRYAAECKEKGTEQQFIKMPQNFISSGLWKQYAPKFLPSCPHCHGKGVYEKDGGMVMCECDGRYGA